MAPLVFPRVRSAPRRVHRLTLQNLDFKKGSFSLSAEIGTIPRRKSLQTLCPRPLRLICKLVNSISPDAECWYMNFLQSAFAFYNIFIKKKKKQLQSYLKTVLRDGRFVRIRIRSKQTRAKKSRGTRVVLRVHTDRAPFSRYLLRRTTIAER